ncbi:alpha/beta fold hydrolase [Rhizobium paknamense]|uniref:Pimeloyl-ACP methyl ester carboxylesterase n=1 Tax=Rhizobium paknamense TaxID=1206817 RepID=A0ABU0IFY0_9HYPH|nr:alpha/beta fold hydrolase [Rhizobium paknamense]MDQ0456335.1 pimeloyl-ACP methyl ester carboxylesterase [Rhizobium paknamense]
MRISEAFKCSDGTVLNVDSAGQGAPVLFQHGLCGDANQTDEAFPPKAGFRRITVEVRGHGPSHAGDLTRLSIATFAEDIAAYIETHLPFPLPIGGISMGAAIALRLAVHRPDLVKALVLVRPAWITAAQPANMQPNAEVGRLLQALPAKEAKAAFLVGETARHLSQEAPDNLASLTGFFHREPLSVTAALLTRISQDGPGVSDQDLARLSLPVLILGHTRDAIHPIASARALAERIPSARFKDITPKAESRSRYLADLHLAISSFLKDLPQ